MADARVTQPSFTAGEISPELYGRQDLAKYQVGCRLLENMFVHPYGGISNRTGLKFATEVKDSTKHVKLQKFEAALDEAFLVETGDGYFRYLFEGGYVLNGGVPAETVTSYTAADLDKLYLEQSNDVATLAHPLYPPQELRRTASSVWTLSGSLTFAPAQAAPVATAATATEGYTSYDSSHLQKAQTYVVAAIGQDGEESLPSNTVTCAPLVLGYEKNYVTITWNATAGAASYVVYKAKNGVYGFIGRTPDLTFRDTNFDPDFTDGPQSGTNPFVGAGNYPSIAAFVQQRRVFAATLNHPQTIYMSQSANFNNFGVSTPSKDDDSIEITLAAQKKQDIFHVVALEKGMIVFTRSGEWRVTGNNDDVMTPSSIRPEPQSYYGSAANNLKPIIAGQNLLYVPRSQEVVYEMEYSIQVDRYQSNNLALLSNHLFRNRQIVNWSYSAEKNGIIWCVMDDGGLLSLTYLKEHDVWGWGRHSTKGKFLDVMVVPEKAQDTAYFIVERRIGGVLKKYIEYLPPRDFVDVEDCFFVDAGLSYDLPQAVTAATTGASTTQITVAAHGYANGDTVDITALTFSDAEGETVLDYSGRYVVSSVTTNTFRITVDTSEASTLFYDLNGVVRQTTMSVGGLGHLEGRKVVALCDGSVVEDLIVIGGIVSFDNRHSRVHVGLPYVSRFWSLDIVNPQTDGNGIKKGTPKAYVRVDRSRGFSIGNTPETTTEVEPRSYENYGDPASLITGKSENVIWGEWDEENQVAIIQTFPLPLTVLSITTEIDYGGS